MKLIPSMILAALCAMTVAVPATARDRHCRCGDPMPAPPAPPAAPSPPSEPGMPAMPPPPPPPPAPPDAPAEAHAACAAKSPGTKMSYSGKPGMTFTGTCERDNRGMYFEVTSVRTVE